MTHQYLSLSIGKVSQQLRLTNNFKKGRNNFYNTLDKKEQLVHLSETT